MAITEIRGWSTDANPEKVYAKEIDAARADGRERVTTLLGECVSGYDAEIDINQVLARADDLISALEDAKQ